MSLKVFPNYQNPNHVPIGTKEIAPIGGLELRDYFAGQALTGAYRGGDTDIDDAVMVRRCYEIADAMLKARQ